MSWNCRILIYKNGSVGIHEVFYDEKGLPIACTEDPIYLTGNDIKDLKAYYELIKEAFEKEPLLYEYFEKLGRNKNENNIK